MSFALWCGVVSSASALLIGAPTFTSGPSSTLGPITGNTLGVVPLPNGFTVTGQIQVAIAPFPTTPLTGTLLSYTVEYPIDPSYPLNPGLFTTTIIDGFSSPPPGVAGNTAGYVHSAIVTLPSTYLVPSISNIPLSLVAGVDNPAWTPPIPANSSTFPFAGAAGMVLRQEFFLDGIYSSGPGGTWTIDLPVTTFVTETPEPSTALLGLAGGWLVWGHRRRRCLAR